MRMGVVGCGYVGLVTAACFADMGHEVRCYDVDEAKLRRLRRGEVPIYEPGLAEIIAHNAAAGRLGFDSALAACVRQATLVVVAVGTPPGPAGGADLTAVEAACDGIADVLQGDCCVLVKSTVPPGSNDALAARLQARLAALGAGHAVEVVSNPEFLKEGMAVEDFRRPDRIVVGVRSSAGEALMRRLYEPFLRNGHPLLVMSPRSAELAKYASNVMLAARISMMNELAGLCDGVGADVAEVRRAVGSDRRIGGAFLYAGLGYGGSCFPKDVQALSHVAQAHGVPAPMLQAVHAVNERQKVHLVERLRALCDGSLRGVRVALWGLAFKPRTDDVREAPALAMIRVLVQAGAQVVAHDPIANARVAAELGELPGVMLVAEMYAALADADALIVCTEWDVFRTPDFARMRDAMRTPRLLDGRNVYDPAAVRAHGFAYVGVGRAAV